jgi:hypothetical protein
LQPEEAPELVASCRFVPFGVVYRMRLDQTLTLSLSDPTQVVAKTTLAGTDPAPCPSGISVGLHGAQQSSTWELGGPPDAAALVRWVQPFAVWATAERRVEQRRLPQRSGLIRGNLADEPPVRQRSYRDRTRSTTVR